jgi:ATP-dependent DNA helicase RecG
MANTEGGLILLGVEDDGEVSGVSKPDKLRQRFWDLANNRGKISANLLADSDVSEHQIDGKTILMIVIPRADRRQRPVFVGQNPVSGTYRRNFEGDYRCSEHEVSRMLSDRDDEPADSRIVEGFGLTDLDDTSVQQYRNRFSARNPNHPWLNEEVSGFLTKLCAWRVVRKEGREGLTAAGLLMFGRADAIREVEALPRYHVDYRERLSDDPSVRWTDRLTIDGTWEANLFQFYQRVLQKLSADLKMPFQLESDLFRRGETVVHEAVREALVNGLIHADYRGVGGVIVEKYQDRIEVSNPGTLLVSFDQLLAGGVSECRNPALQTMFTMIGAAERAGSGLDKIRRGWQSQHWRAPRYQERVEPTRVNLTMPMVSLMPEDVLRDLRERFGEAFERMSQLEVQILVTAWSEDEVSNSRMRELSGEHAADLTRVLRGLVDRGFLERLNRGRWTTYRVASGVEENSSPKDGDSSPKGESSSPTDGWNSTQKLQDMPDELLSELREIARPAREARRVQVSVTRDIVEQLCSGRYLTAAHLGQLLARNSESLRNRILSPMVEEGLLQLKYPGEVNRPDQAYKRA